MEREFYEGNKECSSKSFSGVTVHYAFFKKELRIRE